MKRSNSKRKALSAFLGVAFVLLIAVIFTGCPNNASGSGSGGGSSGGGNGGGGGGGTSEAPFVEGGVSFILVDHVSIISIHAETEDGNPIAVEGCTETSLANDKREKLHAKGSLVILKGKIKWLSCSSNWFTSINAQGLSALQELYCQYTRITSLNIQGLTALKRLDLSANRLNAEALTKVFNALPNRTKADEAWCRVYNENSDDDNHKDLSNSSSLKVAFDGAKARNWKMQKTKANGAGEEEI